MVKLVDAAKIIRSKNAGPFMLTIDVILGDINCFNAARNTITKELVGSLYKLDEKHVEIIIYEQANAIKINIPRATPSGHPGDTDVYGAQQHAPLLDIEIPCKPGKNQRIEIQGKTIHRRPNPRKPGIGDASE